MTVQRRKLITFGFLRERKGAAPETAPPKPTSFSLEQFYRQRQQDGSSRASLPRFEILANSNAAKARDD